MLLRSQNSDPVSGDPLHESKAILSRGDPTPYIATYHNLTELSCLKKLCTG